MTDETGEERGGWLVNVAGHSWRKQEEHRARTHSPVNLLGGLFLFPGDNLSGQSLLNPHAAGRGVGGCQHMERVNGQADQEASGPLPSGRTAGDSSTILALRPGEDLTPSPVQQGGVDSKQ